MDFLLGSAGGDLPGRQNTRYGTESQELRAIARGLQDSSLPEKRANPTIEDCYPVEITCRSLFLKEIWREPNGPSL